MPELFRELPSEADVGALELVVGRRALLRIDGGDWAGRADELRIVGEGGAALQLVVLDGGGLGIIDSLTVAEGRMSPYAVPATARFAVLLVGGQEVTRFRLDLVAGEVALLQL